MCVNLMVAKLYTFQAYLKHESWLKMQHGTSIKQLHSDRGGEYLSNEFAHHLKASRTERKLTTHDTPEHNGIAKHLNHMLVEHVRMILHASGLPKNLWREALMHVVWVENRSATRSLDRKTPYEMLYGKKPDLENLPTWGVKCWVLDRTRSKLDNCAKESHWIGFDAESAAHRIYLPDQHTVAIERNVTFQHDGGAVSVRLETDIAMSDNDQLNLMTRLNNAPVPAHVMLLSQHPLHHQVLPATHKRRMFLHCADQHVNALNPLMS